MVEDPAETNNLIHETQKVKALQGDLQKWLNKNKPFFGESEFETNDEAINRLRSLGYVE